MDQMTNMWKDEGVHCGIYLIIIYTELCLETFTMCVNTNIVLFQPDHPHPGQCYTGLREKAYLQNSAEGQKVTHLNDAIHCTLEHEGKQNISLCIKRPFWVQ